MTHATRTNPRSVLVRIILAAVLSLGFAAVVYDVLAGWMPVELALICAFVLCLAAGSVTLEALGL